MVAKTPTSALFVCVVWHHDTVAGVFSHINMEEVFSKLRANLGDIVALKKSGDQDLIGAKTHSMNGSLLLVDFKQANREAYESVHDLKEETHGIKIELDQAHMQLQNLQYQKSYFLKEIRSCKEFASAFSDKQMDMLPEKDFLQKTPKELTQDADGNPLDAHNLMLKRLACELDERKQLCQTLEELKNRKKVRIVRHVTTERKRCLHVKTVSGQTYPLCNLP